MRYNKGKCFEDYEKIYHSKSKNEDINKGESELYSKFDFRTQSESKIYLKLLLQQCNDFEVEINRYIYEINNLSSGIWGSNRKLKKYLESYFELVESKNELKSEINDLQKYRVAWGEIIEDQGIEMLTACYEKIEKDSQLMFNLINMHMREISGARVTTTNILISVVAIIVAVVLSA